MWLEFELKLVMIKRANLKVELYRSGDQDDLSRVKAILTSRRSVFVRLDLCFREILFIFRLFYMGGH